METIPLFPLSAVLFPQGRMALQIFEPRYTDLVSQCLKNDTGFGVVWLREGSETFKLNTEVDPRLAQIGTYAKIVDWDSLANGLLGVTIEGSKKFRLLSSYQKENHQYMADVEWLEPEPRIPLPEQSKELQGMLLQLLEHPHIARLKLHPEVDDVASLGGLLAQLLPLAENIKFELLTVADPLLRLQHLTELLDQFSE
ncbi:MAG: LON peptidase substrate-binding domain-containing protein [Spongiibacteraceae bacterium]|jgi:Lon protease-like protein